MSVLWREQNRHPAVAERDYKRFLRFPVTRSLEGPLAENAAWARAWFAAHARPWIAACRLDAAESAAWAQHLEEADAGELIAVAVSAGPEAEAEAAARWQADEPDRYFFLECYAAAVVEALLAEARQRLGAERHACPGYPGWPIAENVRLSSIVRAAGALGGPLEVLPSGMLLPKKSQLAVCVRRAVPAILP